MDRNGLRPIFFRFSVVAQRVAWREQLLIIGHVDNMEIICCILVLLVFSNVSSGEEEQISIEVVEKPPNEKCQRLSKDGDLLAMHYTGRLEKDGSVFDSSHNRGQTFDFTLGKGMVIQGWDQGLKDMCVGEKRKLRVPAHLGKLFRLNFRVCTSLNNNSVFVFEIGLGLTVVAGYSAVLVAKRLCGEGNKKGKALENEFLSSKHIES